MTGALAQAPARPSVAGALRDALALRHAARCPGEPVPGVVSLGTHNLLGSAPRSAPGTADPEAGTRVTATVHLSAATVLIGPFPGDSGLRGPCGHCLALRWQRLRPEHERGALELGFGTGAVGPWPLLPAHLVEMVWELHRAAGAQPSTADALAGARIWALELESLRVRSFPLVADPLCPHCGPETGEPRIGTLGPAPKRAPDDYRQRSPRSFRLPAEVLANPVCGVLGPAAVQTITAPTTAPVTGRVLIRGHYGLADMSWSGQANSYQDSRDLAFFEGLERYAGIARRHREAPVLAAYADLTGQALDPRECGTYSALTYQLDPACEPFDPDAVIPWVSGWRLSSGEPVLVPRRLVYYGGETEEDNFVFESSNGCASGASLPEAILFGLLELIERDSFVLGWYGGAELTEIDVRDSADTELRMMLDRAALQGYDVRLFDNRIDLAVPAVTGVAVRRDGGPGTLSFAAGAGLDPYAAVRGAVAEILTYLPELPVRLRDRIGEVRAMREDYFLVRQLRDHPALFSLPEMTPLAGRYLNPRRTLPFDEVYADWQRDRPRTRDLREDLELVRSELAAAGLEVIVVEQTAPEQRALGLHTVSTIVPGLLPLDFGWARQRALHMPRMFSAYRRAGWREHDLTPADLHRVPHPFP